MLIMFLDSHFNFFLYGFLFCFVLFVFLLFLIFETGSCCVVQAGLELTFIAQAGLELSLILLPQPLKCWDYRRELPRPALNKLLTIILYLF